MRTRRPIVGVGALSLALVVSLMSSAGAEDMRVLVATGGQVSAVKLDLSPSLVPPGGVIRVRIENGSAEAARYGLAFSLQRFEDGRWVKLPEQKVFASMKGVPAGEVGTWQAIRVPAKAEPGRYRVQKAVFLADSSRREGIALYGYFRVCSDCEVRTTRPGSCPGSIEVNYEAPLAGLPPLPPDTSRDGLDIGPPRLRLHRVGDALNVGSGRFGFELSVDRMTIHRPVFLDGYTEFELDRVDRAGLVVETVATKRQRLGVVAGPGFNGKPFLARVPAKPGLYRFQAQLRDSQGMAVGRYADYLRVVRPVTDVRLMIGGGPVRPGSQISYWIENRGTREVDPLGAEFAFEVFEAGAWSKAPGSPQVFPKLKYKRLPAGRVSGCRSFQIPSDAKPGLYRLSKDVVLESGARRQLTSEFEVSSS